MLLEGTTACTFCRRLKDDFQKADGQCKYISWLLTFVLVILHNFPACQDLLVANIGLYLALGDKDGMEN